MKGPGWPRASVLSGPGLPFDHFVYTGMAISRRAEPCSLSTQRPAGLGLIYGRDPRRGRKAAASDFTAARMTSHLQPAEQGR